MIKKLLFSGLATLVVVAVAVWNLNISFKAEGVMSEIAKANVEALAENELPEVVISCNSYYEDCISGGSSGGRCWDIEQNYRIGWHCYFTGWMSDYCCSFG